MGIDEPVAALPDPAHGRIQDGAIAGGDERGLREMRELRASAPREAGPVGLVHRGLDLRQHVVRRRHGRRGILQRLEGLHHHRCAERPVVGVESGLLRQRLLRRHRNAVGEVGEVGRVRHAVVVEIAVEPWLELLVVLPRECPARRVRDTIVGQDFRDDLAHGRLEQVAALAAEHQAALGHHPRRECRVVIRREVEVVGRGELEAADLRRAGDRRQESGLAFVGQRKLQPRRREHRRVQKEDPGAMRGADRAQAVDLDFVTDEIPIVIRRDACRVGCGAGLEIVWPQKPDLGGFPMGAGLADGITR